MQLVLVFCLIAAAVAAPPKSPSGNVEILRNDNDNIGTGNYNYVYQQNDGTKGEATGELKNGGSENAFIFVRGTFEWVGPDGVTYTGTYTADENGYHPQYSQGQGGAIPDEVIKSLGNPSEYSQGQRGNVPKPSAFLKTLG